MSSEVSADVEAESFGCPLGWGDGVTGGSKPARAFVEPAGGGAGEEVEGSNGAGAGVACLTRGAVSEIVRGEVGRKGGVRDAGVKEASGGRSVQGCLGGRW